MHLAIGFLDHLRASKLLRLSTSPPSWGFIPFSVINPVYNGTKAWLHFWTMNLRARLSKDEEGRNIKVVEIAPPTVATNLHRGRSNPDDNKENNLDALAVEEFMEFVRERI